MTSMLCSRCEAAAGAVCQEGHRRVLVAAVHPCPHGSEPPDHPIFSFSPAQKATQQVWMDLQLLFPAALIIHLILGGNIYGVLGFYFCSDLVFFDQPLQFL